MAVSLKGRVKATKVGIKIVTGVGGGGGEPTPFSPEYGYTVVDALDATQYAVATDYYNSVPGATTYFYSFPEYHTVNWTTRKIYTPATQTDNNGDSFRVVFFEYDMTTGTISYIDPFASGSIETPPSAGLYDDGLKMAHLDPHSGDIWFTVADSNEAGDDVMRTYVARAGQGFLVKQHPYDLEWADESTWKFIGFTADVALYAYIDFGTDWGTQWGTHLVAFRTDSGFYTIFSNILKPAGRKQVITHQQTFAQAFAANGDLYLLIDGRTNSAAYPSKVRLLRYTVPAPNSWTSFDGSGLPPTLPGIVADITPWSAAHDFETGLGSSAGASNESLYLRLFINRTNNTLLASAWQVRPTVPQTGQVGATTASYNLTNIGRYTIAGGAFDLLTRHDGMKTSGGAATTDRFAAAYIVDDWVPTDTYLVESDYAFSTMPGSTWIWTHRTDLINGQVVIGQPNPGDNSQRYYVLEHRSLADWSLIESVDVRTTLDPAVPEYPVSNWINLVDYDTAYPDWRSSYQFAVTYDPTTQSYFVRYNEGSNSLSGPDYNLDDQNNRLVKVKVKLHP